MEGETCFTHKDRVTGRSCTRCGKPACPECLREAPVGSHCWQCVKAARPPTAQRVKTWNATHPDVVTKIIVGVNVLVFIAVQGNRRGFAPLCEGPAYRRLALHGTCVEQGEWYRVVTSGFVHADLLHIAFNMVILYRFGAMLEGALGRARMVGLYFAALMAGSAGALLMEPDAFTVGASGAVYGLVAAAAVGMRQRGIDVWQSGVGPLIAINLVFTFIVPGISIGAHLGGMVGGLVTGALMLRERTTPAAVARGLGACAVVAAVAVLVAQSAVAV
jgi:membrane associated rhomboid family serine protease